MGQHNHSKVNLSPDHWSTLVNAVRCGAIRSLWFISVDFSELDNDVFLIAVGVCGLRSLMVERSVVPGGFVADDLIRKMLARTSLVGQHRRHTARIFGRSRLGLLLSCGSSIAWTKASRYAR